MDVSDLFAAGLIEKDINSDVIWVWSYPTIEDEVREVIMRKCCLSSNDRESADSLALIPFTFGHFGRTWYYVHSRATESEEVLQKVTHVALVLLAKDFNPEKYETLSGILLHNYMTTGNASRVAEGFLSVFTRGVCPDPNGEQFQVKAFDIRKAYIASSIKDVINVFGVETILIYTALLLKKRIVVFHPDLVPLLRIVRALPVLVWQRQNWNIVYPHVEINDVEVADLKLAAPYVAGFTDPAIESHTELYDVFVNVPGNSISVAPHAKESFGMGKIHKEIAMQMVQAAGDDATTEQSLIKELAVKTREIINNLKSFADGTPPRITLELLRTRKMTPAMENFLFNLASAEGLVQL
ncbi:DENN domain-containing protein 10-like [Corticium candelabrum]|uniref:DENN domain-containing protein 10-like n=1 Tax=Corticium candelabrum TaxID=121492 RepID=UPI002E2724C4|nr:DENN domain-containing protein 10-like [Corticium candelabrum]